MAQNYKKLEAQMTPAQLERSDEIFRKHKLRLELARMRDMVGMTQSQLAKKIGMKQPNLSRIEKEGDVQVSTLARIIAGMGGELEIVAKIHRGKKMQRVSIANHSRAKVKPKLAV